MIRQNCIYPVHDSLEKDLSRSSGSHILFTASSFHSKEKTTGGSAQCCSSPRRGRSPDYYESSGNARNSDACSDDEAASLRSWSSELQSSEPKIQKEFVLRDFSQSKKANKFSGVSHATELISPCDFVSPLEVRAELKSVHVFAGSSADGKESSHIAAGSIELPSISRSESDQPSHHIAHPSFTHADTGVTREVRWKQTIGYEKRSGQEIMYETGSCIRGNMFQQSEGRVGGSEETSFSKAMDMSPLLSSDGSIDARFFHNLKEVLPLMEPFMDLKGNQHTPFSHKASLVYTRAPYRDGGMKKVLEGPLERQTSTKLDPKQERKTELVLKEERDLMVRHSQAVHVAEEASRKPYMLEHLHLESEIEELKRRLLEKNPLQLKDLPVTDAVGNENIEVKAKFPQLQDELWRKDHVPNSEKYQVSQKPLQLNDMPATDAVNKENSDMKAKVFQLQDEHRVSDSEKYQLSQKPLQLNDNPVTDAVSKENLEMKAKILQLQDELRRKDRVSDSEKYQLSQKQLEVAELQSILEKVHIDVVRKNEDTAAMEKEMEKLHRQVTTLSSRLDILDIVDAQKEVLYSKKQDQNSGTTFSQHDFNDLKKDIMETEGSWFSEDYNNLSEKLETARRMYLAAILAAREKPGEESIALVAELRLQLQGFLLHSDLIPPRPDHLVSQTLAFPFV
ncbi:hypothetical protein O6H91_01G012300 [Diphasiastrum complanatum]|uniref:Uncharacterized protein n=4 Tax=Diphasiastrum complanatum TaxID=34168 RepID=A0ACC2ENE3_DIPCM|nr:hypothetical protein O6H91_01G012300 [Diphasiastrum complanatum]KAJ7567926.1 hypothetical protein O6H91_01G012300 [Diphasiastrum complanatum]KAJ7567927.1 hypothetical protein O6H91_01G012300 [Diphasiastrum complanatum]